MENIKPSVWTPEENTEIETLITRMKKPEYSKTGDFNADATITSVEFDKLISLLSKDPETLAKFQTENEELLKPDKEGKLSWMKKQK